MTDAQRRYVRTEMIVAAIINAVLSVVFLLIVFGGRHVITVGGRAGLAADAIPQTLMIVLMSMLVPTLLTRRRLAAGRVAPMQGTLHPPHNVLVRSVLVATAAAAIAWSLHAILMPLGGPNWPFLTASLFKTAYGAVLGATVARLAVGAALSEGEARITAEQDRADR